MEQYFLYYYMGGKLRKSKNSYIYNVGAYVFCIYVLSVLFITRIISDYGWHFTISGQAELIPFQNGIDAQDMLNVIMFIPLGIFLPILGKKKWSMRVYAFLCIAATLCIETIFMRLNSNTSDST